MILRLALTAYAIACATYAPAWQLYCHLVHAAHVALEVRHRGAARMTPYLAPPPRPYAQALFERHVAQHFPLNAPDKPGTAPPFAPITPNASPQHTKSRPAG